MDNLKISIDKHKPLIVFILRTFASLSIIIGMIVFWMAVYSKIPGGLIIGLIYLLSGILSGTILTALSFIVEYLYLIVMKLYFDAKDVKTD